MKRTLIVLSLLSVGLTVFVDNAYSCGDKFLVIGRGLRYERAHAATHPASILIYAPNPDTVKDLQKMLSLAGHTIKSVGDEQLLFSSLKSDKYDVVLLNLSDAALMESKIIATSNKPVVLPVIYKKGDANIDVNAKQYPCVLKFKDKNNNPITVIDQVMDDRLKGKPVECNWSKKT